MPNIPTYEQEPMALHPVIEELDATRSVVESTIEDLPEINPEQRITIARLAGIYGKRMGPADSAKLEQDTLLNLNKEDFAQASPASLETGLYIPYYDPRFNSKKTEQLIRVAPLGKRQQEGVVFPANEFRKVARSPKDLTVHMMAHTRNSNSANKDRVDVNGRVGRSAGHVMEDMIKNMNVLENVLLQKRSGLLIPLYRETYSGWQSHFKAKNLDKKRKTFDEELHYTIETASLNLNLGSTAVKAAHRAAASNMYRRGSSKEMNAQWQGYVGMMGRYVGKRVEKLNISRAVCHEVLNYYQAFLDTKAEQEAKAKSA